MGWERPSPRIPFTKTETTQDDKLTIVYTCKTIEKTDSLTRLI